MAKSTFDRPCSYIFSAALYLSPADAPLCLAWRINVPVRAIAVRFDGTFVGTFFQLHEQVRTEVPTNLQAVTGCLNTT